MPYQLVLSGVNSALQYVSIPVFTIGASDFDIEFTGAAASDPDDTNNVIVGYSSASFRDTISIQRGTNQIRVRFQTTPDVLLTCPVTTGQNAIYRVTRVGNTLTAYKDGVATGTATVAAGTSFGNGFNAIGRVSSSAYALTFRRLKMSVSGSTDVRDYNAFETSSGSILPDYGPTASNGTVAGNPAWAFYSDGTSTYNFTGTGGVSTDGVGRAVRVKPSTSSGGAQFSGAAVCSKVNSSAYAGAGGLAISGSADVSYRKVHDYISSGGLALSGAAEIARLKVQMFAASGGMGMAGSASVVSPGNSLIVIGAGKISTGGTANRAYTRSVVSKGGILTGGQAVGSKAFSAIGSGGCVISGSAVSARTLWCHPRGGMAISGEAAWVGPTPVIDIKTSPDRTFMVRPTNRLLVIKPHDRVIRITRYGTVH